MNSDFISSPSVLPGVSTPSLICDSLGSLGESYPHPQPDSRFRFPSNSHTRTQGHVYSLSGQATAQSWLGQSPRHHQRVLSFVPYGVEMAQRCHTIQKARALPYQKGHLDQFLSLEKDTEHLMRALKAQIRQE